MDEPRQNTGNTSVTSDQIRPDLVPHGKSPWPKSTPEEQSGLTLGDPIDVALAKAIELAAAAEQWETVQTLSRELGERRRARVAPEVPSLEDKRRGVK